MSAGAIFATSLWVADRRKGVLRPTLLLIAAALPVIEQVQALSLSFLAVGLVNLASSTHTDAGLSDEQSVLAVSAYASDEGRHDLDLGAS